MIPLSKKETVMLLGLMFAFDPVTELLMECNIACRTLVNS